MLREQSDGLHLLSYRDIDLARWDACVSQSAEEINYAYSWYLRQVCARWAAIVELKDGEYVSVLPLPEKNILFFNQIYHPFFCQQFGLFTTAKSQYCELPAYLSIIPKKYQKVYLQLNTHNILPAQSDLVGFKIKRRSTYHLGLSKTYDQLYAAYTTNQKRNLKKAKLLQVEANNDIAALIDLFKKYKGQKVPELNNAAYNRLKLLYQELTKRNKARILEARNGKQLMAAALFLYNKDKIIYLFGASSAAGKKLGAMSRLLDAVIRENAGNNIILDFEGSDKASLAKFYAGFGAEQVSYVSLERKNLPWYLKWLRK